MRVFVTGATGFIGSAIVLELIGAGHQVVGLARSDSAARLLMEVGAEIHRGDLEDLDSLRIAAEASDGVIHTGFIHDFSKIKEACETDRYVIETFGSALAGSVRPLIVTSGIALVSPGRFATEKTFSSSDSSSQPRLASEEAANNVASLGVFVTVVRLSPSVHGNGDHGFVSMLINIARKKGISAYVGEGLNRWTAIHRLDVAHLYRLALENPTKGKRFHGVAEEGIAFRDIAEVIGRQLNIPVVSKSTREASDHFGWFANFAALDCPASSKLTQEYLGWRPIQPTLLADLECGNYFKI